mgnify:CR=1
MAKKTPLRLNIVRSGRPEQWPLSEVVGKQENCLNVVRPGRPEQSATGSSWTSEVVCLNVVRPGRPEQLAKAVARAEAAEVSM